MRNKIIKLTPDEIKSDSAIYYSLVKLQSHSYTDPHTVVDDALNRYSNIYVEVNKDNELVGVFSVAWEPLELEHRSETSVFMGMIATDKSKSSAMTVKRLLKSFIKDAQDWESKNNKSLIIWGKTANCSVMKAFYIFFDNVYPQKCGFFPTKKIAIISAIKRQHFPNSEPLSHPFILRGVSNYRYKAEERESLILSWKKFNFFEYPEPSLGDRVFAICDLPVHH